MKQFFLTGVLRLVTGLGQFAVVIFLTASLSLENLGTYSLLVIYLTYAAQVAGLNFYTYVLREQAVVGRAGWSGLLQRQWVFLAISTTLVCLAIACLEGMGVLRLPAIGWFVPLLALSVLNAQHENFLIGAGWPVEAAVSLLIRTSWIYAVILLNFVTSRISFDLVLAAWLLAELIGAVFTLSIFAQRGLLTWRWLGLDINWLLRGIKVGFHYTILGVFLIASFSIQRVVLGHLDGDAAVGIFHFFYIISVFGPNLLEASLFAVLLPKLIARSRAQSSATLLFPAPWTFALLGGLGAAGLTVLYFLLPFFIHLLGKSELIPYLDIFPITAAYAILYTVARVFHYSLYAANADRWLLFLYGGTCAVACVASIALVMKFGVDGAAWALFAAGVTLLAGSSLPFLSKRMKRVALRTR